MNRRYGKQELDKINKIDQGIRESAQRDVEEDKKQIKELKDRKANGEDSKEIEEKITILEKKLKEDIEIAYGRD